MNSIGDLLNGENDPVKLLELLMSRINGMAQDDIELIVKAYRFAEERHRGQARASGEPFIIHPLSVAINLSVMNVDKNMIITGLLHDVVEDTEVTLNDISEMFGADVAFLVDGVTKITKLKSSNSFDAKAETIRKMLLAMIGDPRVIIIKFADKLHNMRTLGFLREDKQRRIATETLEIYAPLAGKLGLNTIKTELEDLSFKHLFRDSYELIDETLKQWSVEWESSDQIVQKKLREKLIDGRIPFKIKSRNKHYYSIFNKMRKYNKKIEEIFDLHGLRIITDTVENCYQIFGLVHSLWQPIPGRFKDYIANPKENGYRSLHTTVLLDKRKAVEIQIRTQDMDEVNEYGIAAHWYYKKGESAVQRELDWLNKLKQVHNEQLSSEEYYEQIRDEILKDQIFVFTPKGDPIQLPKGATAIDLAYRIHTDIGNRCKGAKGNGKIIPLDAPLENGMIVDILTTKTPNPRESWLSFVKTTHAQRKIRHELIRYSEKNGYSDKHDRSEKPEKPEKPDKTDKSDKNDRLDKTRTDRDESRQGNKSTKKTINETGQDSTGKFKIEVFGEKNVLFAVANCCNPAPSDDCVGLVSRGRGIIIHKRGCSNLKNVKDRDLRLLEIKWGK